MLLFTFRCLFKNIPPLCHLCIAHGSTILFTAAEISLADYLMKQSRVLVGSLGTDRDRAVRYLDKMSTWRRWWHYRSSLRRPTARDHLRNLRCRGGAVHGGMPKCGRSQRLRPFKISSPIYFETFSPKPDCKLARTPIRGFFKILPFSPYVHT